MDLLFGIILLCEIVAFYYFYQTEHGGKAIYVTWFAWVIDILGIASGCIIMGISIFIEHHPQLFNFLVPNFLILLLFIQGSWQASIHTVKWLVRSRL